MRYWIHFRSIAKPFHVKDLTVTFGVINLEMQNAVVEEMRDFKSLKFVVVHPPAMKAQSLLAVMNTKNPMLNLPQRERNSHDY